MGIKGYLLIFLAVAFMSVILGILFGLILLPIQSNLYFTVFDVILSIGGYLFLIAPVIDKLVDRLERGAKK